VLSGFLESVRGATSRDIEVDVVVVDSGSSREEVSSARAAAERVGATFDSLPSNGGYGAGINAAARRVRDADYLLVSNPDIELGPGSLDALLDVLAPDPAIGAVGPRILNLDSTVYPSARRLPSTALGLGHALFANVWPSNPWSARYRNADLPSDRPSDVGWLSGACLLMRGDVFRRLGGFDERFFMYFEDVDLGRRIGLAGLRNVYVPGATVRHVGGHSTASASRRMLAVHHRSAALYFAVRHPEWYWAPARVAVAAGLAVRNLIEAATRRGSR
jgi:N-acetylglucosaminyl-diphospho-decaprenol L-rhamnosyltransferase